MYAENLYIALYDEERQAMNWPFVVDIADDDFPDPERLGADRDGGHARG